jgi:predicted DCC family thiol-disulfide oxidoreductase YuxK
VPLVVNSFFPIAVAFSNSAPAAQSQPTSFPAEQLNGASHWQINLLYDGDCPLCMREVNLLRQRDQDRGLITFTNIAAATYNPAANGGVDFETAMGRIHAVKSDGTILKNVEVFREIYGLLGMGWIYAPTRWPILGSIIDWLYGLWADWRLPLTGRSSLKTLMAQRQQQLSATCEDRCRI